jgi:hypothetical protein
MCYVNALEEGTNSVTPVSTIFPPQTNTRLNIFNSPQTNKNF